MTISKHATIPRLGCTVHSFLKIRDFKRINLACNLLIVLYTLFHNNVLKGYGNIFFISLWLRTIIEITPKSVDGFLVACLISEILNSKDTSHPPGLF